MIDGVTFNGTDPDGNRPPDETLVTAPNGDRIECVLNNDLSSWSLVVWSEDNEKLHEEKYTHYTTALAALTEAYEERDP